MLTKQKFITLIAALTLAIAASAETPITLQTTSGEIYGTLVAPENASRTAVLIIAGSGPTDRNGNSVAGISTNAYKMLADSLAAHGYASLRYDKRGIAASAAAHRTASPLMNFTILFKITTSFFSFRSILPRFCREFASIPRF